MVFLHGRPVVALHERITPIVALSCRRLSEAGLAPTTQPPRSGLVQRGLCCARHKPRFSMAVSTAVRPFRHQPAPFVPPPVPLLHAPTTTPTRLPRQLRGSMNGYEYLLELVMRATTSFTSKRPDDWGKVLGDADAVAAMLDRLLQHGHLEDLLPPCCPPASPFRWS